MFLGSREKRKPPVANLSFGIPTAVNWKMDSQINLFYLKIYTYHPNHFMKPK